MKNILILFTLSSLTLFSCSSKKEHADLIVHHAIVYTVDGKFTTASAFAIRDGKFLAIGTDSQILENYSSSEIIDVEGKSIYPGFIDAHCHFYNYGLSLQEVDLTGTNSFEEVLTRVQEHRKKYPNTTWLKGRGWDQNDWKIKEFPNKKILDKLFPEVPILLERIDGHAALVNQLALDLAEINASTKLTGGTVVLENGLPTGVLIDNAVDLVKNIIPQPSTEEKKQALLNAQKNCFQVGLTTVDDAGLDKNTILLIDELQKSNDLWMRVYAMISAEDSNKNYFYQNGPISTERLTARSFKIYTDGALGSRGACLLQPYSDKPDSYGFLLKDESYYREQAQDIYDHGFQMNTHCIGDSANHLLLKIYAEVLKSKNDLRWRIEHAQVVAKDDQAFFNSFSIIPSVQPTHATSDMYWATDRLGTERIKCAYAYNDLLNQAGMLSIGSDFPVENINPLYGFHSAIARKDAKNYPSEGFQSENKITREQALKGMTIWAAFSNFEEKEKGSIEKNKYADFVVLAKDIMLIPENEIRKVKVLATYVGGRMVY